MTRDEVETTKATMRAEFASARAEFLATATPFELKIDRFAEKAEKIAAIIFAPILGPAPINLDDEVMA